jgi:hypothetical protein
LIPIKKLKSGLTNLSSTEATEATATADPNTLNPSSLIVLDETAN